MKNHNSDFMKEIKLIMQNKNFLETDDIDYIVDTVAYEISILSLDYIKRPVLKLDIIKYIEFYIKNIEYKYNQKQNYEFDIENLFKIEEKIRKCYIQKYLAKFYNFSETFDNASHSEEFIQKQIVNYIQYVSKFVLYIEKNLASYGKKRLEKKVDSIRLQSISNYDYEKSITKCFFAIIYSENLRLEIIDFIKTHQVPSHFQKTIIDKLSTINLMIVRTINIAYYTYNLKREIDIIRDLSKTEYHDELRKIFVLTERNGIIERKKIKGVWFIKSICKKYT